MGQRLWLDDISLLQGSDKLVRYFTDFSVTGLESNLESLDQAISTGDAYSKRIRALHADGLSGGDLYFELAILDIGQAADLLRSNFEASRGVDGWVCQHLSPLLCHDAASLRQGAVRLHKRAAKPNLMIGIPGTRDGLHATEQLIYEGIPVNVTSLFSREHAFAAAQAYIRGIERRLADGLHLHVESVASVSVSRWDTAVSDKVAASLQDRLGIAMAMRTYKAHCDLLASSQWSRLAVAGARPQRLLWMDTETPTASAPDTLYVSSLFAPGTISSMTVKTLLAFANHGKMGEALPTDGGYSESLLQEFAREGVDGAEVAARLQREVLEANTVSWYALLSRIGEKCVAPAPTMNV